MITSFRSAGAHDPQSSLNRGPAYANLVLNVATPLALVDRNRRCAVRSGARVPYEISLHHRWLGRSAGYQARPARRTDPRRQPGRHFMEWPFL